MPSILTPIAERQRARSSTSGSLAALTISVSPRLRLAASSAVSVAPTEENGKTIRAPVRPRGAFASI